MASTEISILNIAGELGSAAAAFIALLVWGCSIRNDQRKQRNRVLVAKELMIEELARVSAHNVHVWRMLWLPRLREANMRKFAEQVKNGLQVGRAESLLAVAADIPQDLAVAVAKFAVSMNMLSNTYVLMETHLEERNGVFLPVREDSFKAMKNMCERAELAALNLAEALEDASNLKRGAVRDRVVRCPARGNAEEIARN